MNDNIYKKDREDWEKFVLGKDKLKDKDQTIEQKRKSKKIIDLHGFTLAEANIKVEKFINNNFRNNINKLIVVTGKGLHSKNKNDPYVSKDLSILKYSDSEFIKK